MNRDFADKPLSMPIEQHGIVLMRLNDETYTNVPDSPGFSGKISTC
jgi:hypothetical protein